MPLCFSLPKSNQVYLQGCTRRHPRNYLLAHGLPQLNHTLSWVLLGLHGLNIYQRKQVIIWLLFCMGSEKWPSIPILDGKSDRGLLFVIMACSSTKMGGNGHRNWFLVLPKLLYLSCLAPFQNLRLILFDCASNSALNKSKGDWISICWRGWKELDCWPAIDREKAPEPLSWTLQFVKSDQSDYTTGE